MKHLSQARTEDVTLSSFLPILTFLLSYFEYQKQQFRISENKHLFQISKTVIMDIQNNYFGYPK